MEQLTNRQAARIFAAYAGAKCTAFIGSETITGKKITEIAKYGVSDSDVKLILTPLCEINEADAVAVVKIADKNVEYKYNGEIAIIDKYAVIRSEGILGTSVSVVRYSGDKYFGQTSLSNSVSLYSIEQIDYLRSKGYDCGYGPFPSLIAAGIAITTSTTVEK